MRHLDVSSLPDTLRKLVTGTTWTDVAIGQSSANTFRLTGPGREVRFLKTSQQSSGAELRDEKERSGG